MFLTLNNFDHAQNYAKKPIVFGSKSLNPGERGFAYNTNWWKSPSYPHESPRTSGKLLDCEVNIIYNSSEFNLFESRLGVFLDNGSNQFVKVRDGPDSLYGEDNSIKTAKWNSVLFPGDVEGVPRNFNIKLKLEHGAEIWDKQGHGTKPR